MGNLNPVPLVGLRVSTLIADLSETFFKFYEGVSFLLKLARW